MKIEQLKKDLEEAQSMSQLQQSRMMDEHSLVSEWKNVTAEIAECSSRLVDRLVKLLKFRSFENQVLTMVHVEKQTGSKVLNLQNTLLKFQQELTPTYEK